MFADIATITVKAGNGGNGLVSFHREKYVAAGGPDGGDGGNGGDVVLVADAQLSTLTDFRYKKIYKADNGQDGRAKKSSGKNGENILISVPAGTLVKDAESGKIIADLKKRRPGRLGKRTFCNAYPPGSQVCKTRPKNRGTDAHLRAKAVSRRGACGISQCGKIHAVVCG